MTRIALYKPQIPPNTGNIARLCVALNFTLDIVGEPAFEISSKAAKRAGLDHWDKLSLSTYKSFKEYKLTLGQRRLVGVSKDKGVSMFDFSFTKNDIFIFGNETRGLPPSLMKCCDEIVSIPMWGDVRSLNLANAVSIIAYQFLDKVMSVAEKKGKHYPRRYFKGI